jgi:cystathionine gamma-synthase
MAHDPHKQTQAVRAGIESDSQYGAVIPPVYLSTNFSFKGFDDPRQYDYTRTGNPTRDALATALADLEGGAGATVTGSGMGAITLACQLLNPGDRVIGPQDCYGGTFRLFDRLSKRGLFNVKLVDQTDADALASAAAEGAKMIWVESPTNPLLRIVDLERVREIATKNDALFVVDNTFLSPALQRPIEFGADLVVHSTTKYLNGHSDVVGGAVVASSDALHQEMQEWANALGLSGSPFDSFLTLRGIRTLFARIQQHERNASRLAEVLSEHAAVGKVFYPGLPDHPGHEIAKRQQKGFGGMVSFELSGGVDAARAFLETVELFSLAESLGGVESLACHPATMTHATFDEESMRAAGIGGGLVRLSAGIEATEDLVSDVLRGLDAVSSSA